MTTAPAIAAELAAFIRERAGVKADDVDFGPTVDLFDYGYLDSFATVEMIERVQERFGVDLGTVDFYGENIRSIDAIAALIAAKGGK